MDFQKNEDFADKDSLLSASFQYVPETPAASKAHGEAGLPDTLPENPLSKANLYQLMTASWLTELIDRGAKKPLEENDVWDMCEQDKCDFLGRVFEMHLHEYKNIPKGKIPPFAWALFATSKHDLIEQAVMFFISMACDIGKPFFIQSILQYLEGKPTMLGISQGYLLVIGVVIISIGSVVSLNYGFFIGSRAGVNFRSITMDLVYRKILTLSSEARVGASSGEIMALVSVDAERLYEAILNGQWAWIAPIAVVIALILIGRLVGVLAAVAGGVWMIMILAGSLKLSTCIGKTRSELTEVAEERIRITSEVLQGIRVVKYCAWEDSMTLKLEQVREREMKLLWKFHIYRMLNVVLLFLSPLFVSVAALVVYTLQGNELDVTTAFTVIAFVNITRNPVQVFPISISNTSEAWISLKRLEKYLNLSDVEVTNWEQEGKNSSIEFHNASFSWSKESPSSFELRNLNGKWEQNKLVMIIGSVGSGKSSLINAILGEMNCVAGSYKVNGQIAYAGQEPWIRNDTIRENILFWQYYDPILYKKILKATGMEVDLGLFAAGDFTEIGENGINLSGGQKARISIARAIYQSQAPIMIFDDVLSAVDVHVANQIFHQAIQTLARSKLRLLVLNSHYHLLQHADEIIVLNEGQVTFQGHYRELCEFEQYQSLLYHQESKETPSSPTKPLPMGNKLDLEIDSCCSDIALSISSISRSLCSMKDKDLIVQEDRIRGQVQANTYFNYFHQFHPSRKYGNAIMVIILVTFALGQLLRVLVDWEMGKWAENAESNSYYLVSVHSFVVGAVVLILFRSVIFVYATNRCSLHLHNQLIKRVMQMPIPTFFDITPVGRILNRFSRDLDLIDSLLPDFFLHYLQNGMFALSIIIICILASYWILIAYIPMIICFVLIKVHFEKTSRELKRLEAITRSPIFNQFGETLNGIHTIRAYQLQSKFAATIRQVIDNNARFFFCFWATERWLATRLDYLSVALVAVVTPILMLSKDAIDPKVAGFVLVYAMQLTRVLQWVIRTSNMTDNNMTAVERLLHYQNLPLEAAAVLPEADPDPKCWPEAGKIEFRNLKLRYRPELDLVLNGISFTIHPQEKIGVVGRTGAGKSSLTAALFRIAEVESDKSIFIDNVDIATIGLKTLRSVLSIIPQDPVLFSGTLRTNLDPFGEFSDEEIWSVLRQVHLFEAIQGWQMGLEFQVAEKGENLSLGQRQLICIGRALLKKSKIVVLDEATASVDKKTDVLIQTTIRETFKDRTVLTIAHRLETILDSDRVLVLDKGSIAEYDTPSNLIKNTNGSFYSLVKEAGLLDEVQEKI